MNNTTNNQKQSGQAYTVVPTKMGKLWLDEAWQYFRAQSRPLVFAVLLLVLIWTSAAIPMLGIVISILSPVFTAGVLLGIRTGFYRSSTQINLFAAWNKTQVRNHLIFLGLVMMLIGLGISSFAGPELAEFQLAYVNGDASLGDFRRVIAISALSAMVISMCTWLALPEIAFRGTPMIKAVMLGLSATMANWRVLSMLGFRLVLVWIAAIVLASIISAILLIALGATPLAGAIAILPLVIVWLLALTIMFVLQYLCWRDILANAEAEKADDIQVNKSFGSDDSEQTQVIL